MSTTTTSENKELVHEYLAAWDEADPEAVTDVLDDDFAYTHEDMTGTETELGVEEFQDLMAGYFEALAEPGHRIHDLVAEEDTVIVRLTYSGRHDGELFGIEPTGNRLAVEEYITFHIEDGAIVDLHSLADDLSLLRQLDIELPV